MTHYESKSGLVSMSEGTVKRVRQLHVDDNLKVMRGMVSETVDLVYLDPPFNSNRNYKIVFRGAEGLRSGAHLPAFEDVWKWDARTEMLFESLLDSHQGQRFAETVSGLFKVIGRDRLMAYLVNMTPRLVEIHRLLKPTGSVYLHCDPTASHYLKVIMDAVFGRENFRNEIVWCYRGGGVPRRDFARKHDVILRFSKSDDYVFNPQYVEYSQASMKLVESRGGVSIDDRERDLERGAHMTDWWSDINSLQTWSPERTGYPTQKPVRLLERIIRSSSDETDLVLDPFCGCGTTMVAAERLGRSWIGIDVEPMALSVLRGRFDRDGTVVDFDVEGLPCIDPFDDDAWSSMSEAEPEKFERAVISLLSGCLPWRNRQNEGKGVEGIFSFPVSGDELGHVIVSVRGGRSASVDDVRAMLKTLSLTQCRGVVAGVLVRAVTSAQDLLTEVANVGTFCCGDSVYPRLSIVTTKELFQRMKIDTPDGLFGISAG